MCAVNGRFNRMTLMAKVTTRWTGFSGAPGYTNTFWQKPADDIWTNQDGSDVTGATYAFFNMLLGVLPPAVKIDVQGDVELIQSSTGRLEDVIAMGARPQLQGSGATAPYSAATGAVVTWRTAGVVRGRRVRGRTFLVPLAGGAYEVDGTLNAGTISTISAAAAGMINNTGVSDPVVWSRPTAVGASDGSAWAILSSSVPDMGAVLRSRRD